MHSKESLSNGLDLLVNYNFAVTDRGAIMTNIE